MIHRTYRSLDAPIKLVGFTLRQWAAIIAGSVAVVGLVALAHLPTKVAISLCTLVIGVPVAITYVSESGGLQLSQLLRDCWRWRWSAHELPVVCPARSRTPGLLVRSSEGESVAEVAVDAHRPEFDELLTGEGWER